MKKKTKKKPTWQDLYEESQMDVFREICKRPQGILSTELRKMFHDMTRSNLDGLLKKLEEKSLIIREHREKPPDLVLVKATFEGMELYEQYLS